MSEKIKRINFPKILAEMTGIVFAVLLALWLEGVREDNELKARAAATLDRIHTEIRENREAIESSIEDNQERLTIMREAAALPDEEVMPAIRNHLAISAGSASSAAWNSAQMTESLSMLDPEVISRLNEIYSSQAYYRDYVQFFFQQYTDITTNISNSRDLKLNLQRFMQHLAISNALAEESLRLYNEYLGDQTVDDENIIEQQPTPSEQEQDE